MEPLFLEERRRAIIEMLEREGRVTVNDLSALMQVSQVTIRQDLHALEEQGVLERTYGGAVFKGGTASLKEMSFNVRLTKMHRQKEAIARAAVQMIENEFGVAMDCSTTAYAMVPFLKKFSRLTVVTNGIVLAQTLLESEGHRVLMPGGRLRQDSLSLVGQPKSLPDINLNVGFFSCRGLSPSIGATEVESDEAVIKLAMWNRCVKPVMLVDGSKWQQVAPYTIVPDDRIRHIITTEDAPSEMIRHYREIGAHVDVVPLD